MFEIITQNLLICLKKHLYAQGKIVFQTKKVVNARLTGIYYFLNVYHQTLRYHTLFILFFNLHVSYQNKYSYVELLLVNLHQMQHMKYEYILA